MTAQKITLSSRNASNAAPALNALGSLSTIFTGINNSSFGTNVLSNNSVTFYASPEMDESGATFYITLDDIRAPSSLMYWMGSPARVFSINAKLISRTQAEAAESVRQKSLLQAWRMPLGNTIGTSSVPEVLILDGYGNQFNSIPVVMQSVNITFPTDVDYIDSGTGFMVPIVWPISVVLKEYHTQPDMSSFDYNQFKAGTLPKWS